MKTLIAIGGGSFQKQETMSIDTYAISRCGKTQPHVLFIPLASRDDQGYAKRFKQYYRSLGCQVEALRLLHTKLSNEEIYKKFRSQDMICLLYTSSMIYAKNIQDYEFFRYDQCIYLSGLRYPYSLYFVYEYEIQ